MESYNSFQVAQHQVREAAKLLHLDPATVELLSWPQREFRCTLQVRMDDGRINNYHAYRIQYNYARGPAKGGIRFHPDETVFSEVSPVIGTHVGPGTVGLAWCAGI